MSLRTLYLQSAPTSGGREGLAGRKLREEFRARSSECLVGYQVLPEGTAGGGYDGVEGGILSQASVSDFHPNLIYIEGGLFADGRGTWKIPWPFAEDLVESGAVLMVADCGTRELCRHHSAYNLAARFLRARAEIPAGRTGSGIRPESSLKEDLQLVCCTEGKRVTECLRPALAGISEITVGNPAKLDSWEEIAASGKATALDSCRGEGRGAVSELLSEGAPWIFASVAQCGYGFVAFVAGEVSSDCWVERCAANSRWLANLSELLLREAERRKARAASPIASPFCFFLSHRSVNKQLAVRVGKALGGLGAQARIDAGHSLPVDSLVQVTSSSFERMTHFVIFWSRACIGAPWVEREVPSAVSIAVERRLPVFVVRSDMTPVPKVISDAFRIEDLGMSPQELAVSLIRASRRIRRNAE